MKELTRNQMAIVKRTAMNVKQLRNKREKIESKINDLNIELEGINATIDAFEAPIVTMTGGFTSAEVLNSQTEKEEVVKGDAPVEQSEEKPVEGAIY